MAKTSKALTASSSPAVQGKVAMTPDEFRMLADNITQLAWIAAADGWIYWYNRRWYEYTGTTEAQMAGWGWQAVHDPAELPKVVERWKASIASGNSFDMVFPLLGADGLFRPFLTRVTPLRNGSGNIERWVGTNTDISEQRRTEQALRVSEERFRSLSASSPVGIFLADTKGQCIYTNPRARTICGFASLEESLGDGWARRIHSQDRERAHQSWMHAVAHRREWQEEFRWVNDNGDMTWSICRGAPMLSDSGHLLGFAGTVEDITGLKQAESRLRINEERLRFAQGVGKVAIWEFYPDQEQLWLSADAAKLLGMSPSNHLIAPAVLFARLFLSSDLENLKAIFEPSPTKQKKEFETTFRARIGPDKVSALLCRGKVFFNQGTPTVIGVFIQIDEKAPHLKIIPAKLAKRQIRRSAIAKAKRK